MVCAKVCAFSTVGIMVQIMVTSEMDLAAFTSSSRSDVVKLCFPEQRFLLIVVVAKIRFMFMFNINFNTNFN